MKKREHEGKAIDLSLLTQEVEMLSEPIIYHFVWNKIEIEVEYKPKTYKAFEDVYGTPLSRLVIKCEHSLPITAAGYYIRQDILSEYGGPLEYLKAWLDDKAQATEWKSPDENSRQLTLF